MLRNFTASNFCKLYILFCSFVSKQCEGAIQGDVNTCPSCMKQHICEEIAEKRKCSRLEKLKNVPLSNRSTLATASKERLQATVIVNRKR